MNGNLCGMLHWSQLDALWRRVLDPAEGWYAVQAGAPAPAAPLDAQRLRQFVDELDALLRAEHSQPYCGIVYADDPEHPTFIKVYDAHHMGSFCGCSSTPVPPRWVLCRCVPEAIADPTPQPKARRHWWERFRA